LSEKSAALIYGEAVVRVAFDSPDPFLGGLNESGVYSEEEHLGDSRLLGCHPFGRESSEWEGRSHSKCN
jgi:hypothetical protein